MDIFVKALSYADPPETFALQTVQEAIKPQRQTKLLLEENQLLENILRTLLRELVSSAVQSGEPIMQYGQSIADNDSSQGQIQRLLDIVLYLCEKEHVEGGMIFQLLEDLTEMSTVKNCKDVFAYIESKQDILGKQELFARGKLVMLRTCNQLLRRLSKANDVVFCGRILMFLAHFFPLSERSAVNIKGVFNTSNETKYEENPPDGISIDFNFYKTFWSLQSISELTASGKSLEEGMTDDLTKQYSSERDAFCQEYFYNPPSLNLNLTKWHRFTSSLMVVLNTFEAQPLSDEVGDANHLGEEGSASNIKYLTSSKLMGLELKDPSFRRHVLVQCLILFDYVKAPGKSEKDVPTEAMKEEIRTCEERVKKLIEVTPPKGKEFLDSVAHILEREKNWVWWKRDGCPPYEQQPVDKKLDVPKKRKPRWRLGNKELSQLWKWADQNPNALTDPERVRTPAVTDYWKPMADDMDPSAGIEAEYHHKNNKVYCWKGLRISARQDLEGFSRFTEFGIEGVVPHELLLPEVASKYQTKTNEKSKRAKKDEPKGSMPASDDNQNASMVSELDGEGGRGDLEAPAASLDMDSTPVNGNNSQGGTPTPDEYQKQGSESPEPPEVGQVDTEADLEPGMIDGETDADVDLDVVA